MTELLHVWRVAKTLGVSRKRVYALIARGELEAVKLGPRQTRIPRDALEAFIEEARRRAIEAHPKQALRENRVKKK